MGYGSRLTAMAAMGALTASFLPTPALAVTARSLAVHQTPLALDGAASAWVLTSTALVLAMTLPGLALFYGGMVRRKNLISTLSHAMAAFGVVSVLWFVAGYSLAFGDGGAMNAWIGGPGALFLKGVDSGTAHAVVPALPELLWVAYQLTFAIITPALIAGAFAERMKFSAALLFFALWHLLVYAPICHWVWGGGFLGTMGVLDFAGGAVVHVSAGVAGLVCAIALGPREGFGRVNMAPHNLALTATGAALLLVGWLGFNGGSAWAPDAIAAAAVFNTILAAAAGALAWLATEWALQKTPTLLGMLSGLVAGLVAVTPAAGFVAPWGALVLGLAAGPVCYLGVVWLKRLLKYDDSLDAFGLHGLGGVVGALLTGALVSPAINPAGAGATVWKQAIGLGAVIAWSAIATAAILVICRFTTGLRVARETEIEGLDQALHGEILHD